MIELKLLEASAAVVHNDLTFVVAIAEIDMIYGNIYLLHEDEHRGSAPVTFGGQTHILSEADWKRLFLYAESYIQQDIAEFEAAESIVLH